jgi:hypothetical protein
MTLGFNTRDIAELTQLCVGLLHWTRSRSSVWIFQRVFIFLSNTTASQTHLPDCGPKWIPTGSLTIAEWYQATTYHLAATIGCPIAYTTTSRIICERSGHHQSRAKCRCRAFTGLYFLLSPVPPPLIVFARSNGRPQILSLSQSHCWK